MLMRPTLVLLSNLRALLVTRAVFLSFLLAVVCASASMHAHALQPRAHHKTASASASHRRSGSGHARVARSHGSRSYAASRRRHRPSIVRARMPIRRYSWMTTRRSAASERLTHRQVAEDMADASARTLAEPSRTSVAVGEDSDPSDTNTATPRDAARQIAAVEMPVAPHAAIHAAIPDALGSKNIVKMAPLRGSLESLIRQNEKTNADNLERIQDDADLRARIANGQLVRVPESDGLAVNPELPEDRRYCRPWTAAFLKDLSKAHEAQFHHGFEVSSAVRTVEYQKRLMRTNGNAAPAEGDVASPHLTGATIDIAKKGLTHNEIYWMRDRLAALQNEGKIDVEEEFRQSCFHITVYKSYVGAGPAHKPVPHTAAPPADDHDTDAADPSDRPA